MHSSPASTSAAAGRKGSEPRPVSSRAPHNAPAPSPRHSNVLTRAISRVIKVSDPPSTTGTRSLQRSPPPQAAAARGMNRMMMTSAPSPSFPSLAPPTRREAMFGLFGALVGGGGVATYFKSVYDTNLKAAETALVVMLEDPQFKESVAQEVLYKEFHDSEVAVDLAVRSEQELEVELRAMIKQMEDMRAEVDEITRMAEARTAAAAALKSTEALPAAV